MKINLTLATVAIVALTLGAKDSVGDTLSVAARNSVETEIREVLDGYRDAMLTRDYDAMIAFWSDSEDFVFAGDGRILGGIDAWKAQTTKDYKETESWEIWDWQNVHILALSRESAAATVEFRFRWVDNEGVTHNSRGAWTNVFRKEDGSWKSVHTNGTHIVL